MSNADTVRTMYEAFGRGDVPAILAHLSPDIEWEYPPTATTVPWLKHRRGHAQVQQFFADLQASMNMERFEPKEILEGDGVVVVLLDLQFTVSATGVRVVEEDEIHVWRFDSQGRVVRFKHGVDTHKHQLACDAPAIAGR